MRPTVRPWIGKITLFYSFCLSLTLATAQPILQFKHTSFDFGEIEEGIAASHDFEFTNTGTEPLLISQVNPSCGCTVPQWSKDPILPGKSGTIKATYNTQMRPGNFQKSINVVANTTPAYTTLYIRGYVRSQANTKEVSTEELRASPKLVVEKSGHDFGKTEKNSKLLLRLQVKNLGRSDLKINSVSSSCNCIEGTPNQEFIESGGEGTLELVYRPNGLGEVMDWVYIKSNDLTQPSYGFRLKTHVVESLSAPSLLQQQKSAVPFK